MRYALVQMCGILLLGIIIYLGNKKRHLNLKGVKAFYFALYTTFVCLVLDMLSVLFIYHFGDSVSPLTDAVCKLYVVSLVWVAFSAFNYLLVGLNNSRKIMLVRVAAFILVGVATLAICIVPIYRHFDSAAQELYSYGPSVILTYIFSFIFIISTIVIAFICRNKDELEPERRANVLLWMGVVVIASLIQLFFNELLLVGFATALGLAVLFERLENPVKYLDVESGLYNNNAFKAYVREKYSSGEDVYGIRIALNIHSKELSPKDSTDMVEVFSSFLLKFKCIAFRTNTYTFAIVTNDAGKVDDLFEQIRQWLHEASITIQCFSGTKHSAYVIKKSGLFKNFEDFVGIFQHLKSYRKVNPTFINNIEYHEVNEDLINDLKRKEVIKEQIVSAMAEDRVEAFFQPIYDTRIKKFTSAEALVRIRDRDGSIISPGVFIPVAEETGLVVPLGERIFSLVCKLMGSEKKPYGLEYIEINLSAIQCSQDNLFESFNEIMEKEGVLPGQINLEITETAQLNRSPVLLEMMHKFTNNGVRFSLDDFGTGNSNLDYVANMPVNIVKFDHSMTKGYGTNARTKLIFEHIIPMIKQMGLEIVCEGVETAEELQIMTNFGIEHIQGYYFSRPIPEDEFVKFINERNGAVSEG